ncbi:hypothetical protein JW979_16560 [bacterium]|nr:hypothetical protein [candidate division CSSED10-310 bacterium]
MNDEITAFEKPQNQNYQFAICVLCFLSIFLNGFSALGQNSYYTWQDQSWGMLDLQSKTITVCPSDPDRLLCATDALIYLSVDAGQSWKPVFRIPGRKNEIVELSARGSITTQTSISKDDYDEEEMRDKGILEPDEEWDDLTDSEFAERMLDAGLIEAEPEILEEEQEILSKQGWQMMVNTIAWDPRNCNNAYLATHKGIYVSRDRGISWQKLRSNLTGDAESVMDLAISPITGKIVAATEEGIYISTNEDGRFLPITGLPTEELFVAVLIDHSEAEIIYTATTQDIYMGNLEKGFSKIFTPLGAGKTYLINLTIDDNSRVVCVSDKRLFYQDADKSWQSVSETDLGGARIHDVICKDSFIYLATNMGVYRYSLSDRFGRFINQGLFELDVQQIAAGYREDSLFWLATRSGIFCYRTRMAEISESEMDMIKKKLMEKIPAINDVIDAAMKYSQIDLKQNANWISQIRKMPFTPEVHLKIEADFGNDTDYSRSKTISILERSVFQGPDDQNWARSKDEDYGVEIRMKWFPQISYQPAQLLNIQKQMASDVKRSHRLAAKIRSLYTSYISTYYDYEIQPDGIAKILKKIELDRLTADLDALTDNYFTNSMDSLK